MFLAVGGGWAVLSRAGATPLGFGPVIVELTAVHFSYAGFVLPLLTGLAAQRLPGIPGTAAAMGVVVGVPLVALGILLGGPIETAAALLLAAAGLGAATLHLRLAAGAVPAGAPGRAAWGVAGASLVAGMALAVAYALGVRLGWDEPTIATMIRWHGGANAVGFALVGLVGWTLAVPGTGAAPRRPGGAPQAPGGFRAERGTV